MLTALSMFLGRWHAKKIDALAMEIGYKLVFPSIAQGWIQGWASVDLSKNWKKFGLDATGIDYFTIGGVVNGVSTRFDPCAEQFQSWIGGYLVRFSPRNTDTLQERLNLAVVDQLDWLGHYGDPHPRCELRSSSFECGGRVKVSGYTGELYVGGGFSHTDIGNRNKRLRLQLATRFIATIFNVNNDCLRLTNDNFIPTIAQPSYSDIFLKGYVICIQIEPNVCAVLYGNGVVYKDEQGRERDTFEVIKNSLLDTLAQVVIAKA
jgi:hypothetical protein